MINFHKQEDFYYVNNGYFYENIDNNLGIIDCLIKLFSPKSRWLSVCDLKEIIHFMAGLGAEKSKYRFNFKIDDVHKCYEIVCGDKIMGQVHHVQEKIFAFYSFYHNYSISDLIQIMDFMESLVENHSWKRVGF